MMSTYIIRSVADLPSLAYLQLSWCPFPRLGWRLRGWRIAWKLGLERQVTRWNVQQTWYRVT